MPARPARQRAPLVLACGDDEFSVKQGAREIFDTWATQGEEIDREIIDASAGNSEEAIRALAKLREALQTLPFFGGSKTIWFKDCNFLGDERTATSQAVSTTLTELAEELKSFSWDGVRLLISAGKVDKRRVFYKVIEKTGEVRPYAGWSVNDRDWARQAEAWATDAIRERNKEASPATLAEIVSRTGQSPAQLAGEIEKLVLYVGERKRIQTEDVEAVCSRNKQARAFALGDALGERDLPTLLRRLDEELWELRMDRRRSVIGLLYGIISKVRAMILLKELAREKWIQPTENYPRFKAQLEDIPADRLPEDRRYSPLGVNPYVLFKALPHAAKYSTEELVRAMDLLLQCNRRLVGSSLDPSFVLQQTLSSIVAGSQENSSAASSKPRRRSQEPT